MNVHTEMIGILFIGRIHEKERNLHTLSDGGLVNMTLINLLMLNFDNSDPVERSIQDSLYDVSTESYSVLR